METRNFHFSLLIKTESSSAPFTSIVIETKSFVQRLTLRKHGLALFIFLIIQNELIVQEFKTSLVQINKVPVNNFWHFI